MPSLYRPTTPASLRRGSGGRLLAYRPAAEATGVQTPYNQVCGHPVIYSGVQRLQVYRDYTQVCIGYWCAETIYRCAEATGVQRQ